MFLLSLLAAANIIVAPQTWTPRDLGSALVAAYDPVDATTLTLSGSSVVQMNDIGPNGYHLTQATSGFRPTYSATGFMQKPCVVLDGVDDYLANASVNLGTTAFAAFAFTQQHYGAATSARLLSYTGSGQAGDYVGPGSVILIGNNTGVSDNLGSYRGGFLSTYQYNQVAPSDGGFYRIASIWNGTNNTLYADGVAQTSVASTGSLATPGTFNLGSSGTASFWKGAVSRIVLMNRAPTAAELDKIDNWLMQPWSRIVVIEGDSKATLSAVNGDALPYTYAYQLIPNLNPPAVLIDKAIGGAGLNSGPGMIDGINNALMTGNRPAWTASAFPARNARHGRQYILFIDIGSNGRKPTAALQVADMESYLATIIPLCDPDKVVITTLLSRTDEAGFDAYRNAYNALIKANGWATANHVDAICDFAADAIMGVDAAPTTYSGTYYADAVHPNTAGYTRLEAIARATINAL